ncbi:MAG TPA: hypothetical protein PKL08_11030 [Thermoanaerobaculaceae bacterium]|nr:hypothetical protein [Thermoanaerobaculaceae bacterium]
MNLLSQFLAEVQRSLFPKLEAEYGPLREQEQRLVKMLDSSVG